MANIRIVVATSAILESVWIYAAMAMVSLILGLDGSPMAWHMMLLLTGLSFLSARALALIIMPPAFPYVIQMTFGIIVIYSVVGIVVQPEGNGFTVDWIRVLRSDTAEAGYLTALVVGMLSVILWWRGGRLASEEYPLDRLDRTFRVGLLILSVAAVVDIISAQYLGIFPLMFLYFAAGLAGLSFGHLLPLSQKTKQSNSWLKVIGGITAAVLFIGLLFSLLQKSILNFITTPVMIALNALLKIFLYVVLLPIVYVIDLLIRGIFGILSRFNSQAEPPQLEIRSFGEMFQEVQEDTVDTGASALLQFLEWTVIAIIILTVLYFLARSFGRRLRWRRIIDSGVRESLIDNSDAVTDLKKLLMGLFPDRFRKKPPKRLYRLPSDDANTIEAFKLYFKILIQAERHGYARHLNQTPNEHRMALYKVFPHDLVNRITQIFNDACYGRLSPPLHQIDEIRNELERMNLEK